MFFSEELEQMPEGGYCFGNKMYIRDQLRELVDSDLLVMDARKVGMNVDARACVILYQGRNITASLTEALMRENRLKISEGGDLLFCSGKQSEEWDIWELKTENGCLELKQPLWKLQEIILECLRKCESFKGNENELYFEERGETFCIYDRKGKYNNNITHSLIEKLLDLELLYNKGGVYLPRDSAEADVGGDYCVGNLLFKLMSFFFPLLVVSALVWMFFGNWVALLLLAGGTVYYAVTQYRVSHYTGSQRQKGEQLEDRVLYVVKWILLTAAGLFVGVLLLDGIGLLVPVLIILYAATNYKKRYRG